MALEGTGVYGRIVIDCGYTKLIKSLWDKTAGKWDMFWIVQFGYYGLKESDNWNFKL